jgi:hypothetical protein
MRWPSSVFNVLRSSVATDGGMASRLASFVPLPVAYFDVHTFGLMHDGQDFDGHLQDGLLGEQ